MIGKGKRLGLISNGEIEICLLSEDDVEEALTVLRKSFFLYENFCVATGVNQPNNYAAIDELTELAREITKDGVSILARHIASGVIAGVALNKLHQRNRYSEKETTTQGEFLENFLDSTPKTDAVKCIMKSLTEIETKFDIFTEWNMDCIVEHFMLSTLPEFGQRNIGYNLTLYSIQLAMELSKDDINEDDAIERDFLPKQLRDCHPKAIYAIFTSKFSHKIGERLGFQDLAVIPYKEFSYKGVNFTELLDPIHENCTLGARKF